MTVNLPFLLLALLMLWFPRQWLRLGRVFKRRRSAGATRAASEPWNVREAGDPRVSIGAEFSKFRNYIDLLRAAAGSLALAGGLGIPASIDVAEGAPRNMSYAVLALRALILLIGLLMQTVRYDKRKVTFYPAIFFIAGLSVGLCDPSAAAFAFAMVWAINAMFGNAQAFLAVYALLIVGFGSLFASRLGLTVILAGFLALLPVLLSLMANRPLVVFSRKGTHASKGT